MESTLGRRRFIASASGGLSAAAYNAFAGETSGNRGGGGNDVFTFCDNWGEDAVEQFDEGSVTLWFASSDLAESIQSNMDADSKTFTCTDGTNSVTVKGVTSVDLKFGSGTTQEDAARFAELSDAGAFGKFSSQKIFEESKGLLASL